MLNEMSVRQFVSNLPAYNNYVKETGLYSLLEEQSYRKDKASPGVHPSKSAAPGTWCFGCDNPKIACKCRKGDDEEYDEQEEEKRVLEAIKDFPDDAQIALKKDYTKFCHLRDKLKLQPARNIAPFNNSQNETYLRLRSYLAETDREILGLDGKPLNEAEIKGLMDYYFLLIPDAENISDIEEVYAILQSHDFQRLGPVVNQSEIC